MTGSGPDKTFAHARLIGVGLTVIALLVVVAASAWTRWPAFLQGGFASHDVAGILYNAMVLEHGGLPYAETLELKAPGSFYLASMFAGPEGRDIAAFQIAANLWALAALICVAGLAWRLWGRIGGVAAAGLYALHDAHLDTMDANYVTWANLPQIAAFWVAIEAARTRSRQLSPALWMCAGALAGFATLCKRPNGVVLLTVLVVAVLSVRRRMPGARPSRDWLRDPGLVLLGFGLAHVPIVIQYLAADELPALIQGYFSSSWGLRYMGARTVGAGEFLREGALASANFLGLPLLLASFVIGSGIGLEFARRRRTLQGEGEGAQDQRDRRFARIFVLVWLLATLLAASLGARFYKGYFLAAAAPACVLAAAPIGLLGRHCTAHWALRWPCVVLCSILVVRAGLQLEHTRLDRSRPHDNGGRRIASHLLANTTPDATIWVWGWHLWDVYPMTGRMSASPIYKSLGILSQPNDDTWRQGASPLKFVASAYSEQLVADLEASRPAYIVLGSTVPHRKFKALELLLRRDYVRDRRVRLGKVQFWRLRVSD